MNDSELDQLLKSASVPERPVAYWDRFSRRVMAKAVCREDLASESNPSWALFFGGWWRSPAFAIGLACGCIVLGFLLGFWNGRTSAPDLPVSAALKYTREIQALFPNQVKTIVFDHSGAHFELAAEASVPSSQPVYITLSGPGGSQRIVTFSGQQIQIGGDVCDVLVDHKGCVLVVGRNLIWSNSKSANETVGAYRLAAQLLETRS